MRSAHDHAIELVDAYLHKALSPAMMRFVEEHTSTCPICEVALAEAQKRAAAIAALPATEASDELIRATEQRIMKARRRPLTARQVFWSVAAAAAVVIAGFNIYYATLAPSPYDLKVLAQQEWITGSEASLRVLLINRVHDGAVSNVPVDVELIRKGTEPSLKLASFRTDEQGTGTPRIRVPRWDDGPYQLRVTARVPGGAQDVTREIRLRRSWQLMLSSDKPVYQPGQVIRLRSLALRAVDRRPVSGQPITFVVADPKGNTIFRKKDVTSRFGIASSDCVLADEITEGRYRVSCQVGDTTSSLTVDVKKYVLPKFKVELSLDRPYYESGARVHGTVLARYFFGKPVTQGQVSITATTASGETVDDVSATTDDQGQASFEFQLPATLERRSLERGDVELTIKAVVTDSADQQYEQSLSRRVTDEAIHIEVLPEGGRLVAGQTNKVYLLTSYPDGSPAQSRLAITGFQDEIRTTDQGAAVIEISPLSPKEEWTVRATDDGGRVGRREVKLQSEFSTSEFLIRTDKALYRTGETMQIIALAGESEPVFIDLIREGQTILTGVIPIKNGRGTSAIDIPPELFGAVELCAYRYSADALPVRKTRAMYIERADALRIRANSDKSEYRPGERAHLTFNMTDDQGRPAAGALSIAIVDEAVFSVASSGQMFQERLSEFERKLLQPITSRYGWTPQQSSALNDADRQVFEQALFATTVRAGGQSDDLLMRGFGVGDIDDEMFEVFERPDWEELAEHAGLSEETIATLRNRGGPHSLNASTYPANSAAVEQAKRDGLGAVKSAWVALLVIGAVVCLFLYVEGAVQVISILVIAVILAALMFPAIQAAREASRRSSAMNSLKQFDFALQNHHNTMTKLPALSTIRAREWFPETLLWRPELITDNQGRADIDVDLADSITTWRLTASGVNVNGALGAMQKPIRVFQPFFVDLNLPVALTRGDEIGVPAIVYNYLDKPQSVELHLNAGPAFEPRGEVTQRLELGANEVRSVSFTLKAEKIGKQELELRASAGEFADAIKREIEIVPDGQPKSTTASGTLETPAEIPVEIPADAIEGSARTILKIYPSNFSQLVEGLDAIFARPYGCFEQTSSTTYPNVLALDYLRRIDKSAPAIEQKARQYIHLGYQRLLAFEISGGGFDWFGNPPANHILSAYGLMEFEDMARVYDIDRAVIDRTRQWLLAQQRPDGSWDPEGHGLEADRRHGRRTDSRIRATAFIAWAVFESHSQERQAQRTLDYLTSVDASATSDPYLLALVANALLALDPTGDAAKPFLRHLTVLKSKSADGKLAWWSQQPSSGTLFYGAGKSGDIEATALAALAFMRAGGDPDLVRTVLRWVVTQKDPHGTWHSTQATVLALKALIAATSTKSPATADRRVEIRMDGKPLRTVEIPADQADGLQQLDLSSDVTHGRHTLSISETGAAGSSYSVTTQHFVSDGGTSGPGLLALAVVADERELKVGDAMQVSATVTNNSDASADMVLVDLPIPAGFTVDASPLESSVASGEVAKFQTGDRSVLVYLRKLPAHETLAVRYGLIATMPVEVSPQPAVAYEYYRPESKATAVMDRLVVGE